MVTTLLPLPFPASFNSINKVWVARLLSNWPGVGFALGHLTV